MPQPKQKPALDGPMVTGLILTVVGGLGAIGICIAFSHDPAALWAIILLIWDLNRVRETDREYHWKPAVLGLVMGIAYLALGIIAWYVNNLEVLWAMILVNWLGDALI